MVSLSGLSKPQYLFRPSQIVRRLLLEFHSKRGLKTLDLPWKLKIHVNTEDTVGLALASHGLYDLVTTEVIYRLAELGETVIDVGANIGYFTGLLAVRVGKVGKVIVFEPHPGTALLLSQNVKLFLSDPRSAQIVVHQIALSSSDGEARLDNFPGVEQHTSYSFLNFQTSDRGIPVKTSRLEHFLHGPETIGVLKIDAQWHEERVLKGAGDYLRSKKIRDIVFEEEAPFPAPSHKILMDAGYHLFWFEEHLRGPKLIPPDAKPANLRSYDIPPSFLATINPERVERIFSKPGWTCF
jgi:FkbM family methyltransferase